MIHRTAQERYEKLRRVFGRLMIHFDRDDLDDFVQTANSLREWIRRDATLTREQKAALEKFVVDQSLDWQICNQLANHQKHMNSRPRFTAGLAPASIPTVSAVQVRPGNAGVIVPPTMRIVGRGEDIVIECDGIHESALGFVVRTFRHFHYIFEIALVPQAARVIPSLTDLLGG
jgi:hypothetical protein